MNMKTDSLFITDDSFNKEVSQNLEKGILGGLGKLASKKMLPDIVDVLFDKLGAQIPQFLLTSWKKEIEIIGAMKETDKDKSKSIIVSLTKHTFPFESHPKLKIAIAPGSLLKQEIEISIDISGNITLSGIQLHIAEGKIKTIESGTVTSSIEITIEKKLKNKKTFPEIKLPGKINLENLVPMQ